jgi:DNA-binding IclR family transcriptional regulator
VRTVPSKNTSKETKAGATNSLERALRLLELVGKTPGGLTNANIARRLQIASSSCSYILTRLEREGYVKRDAEGRYEIGPKLVTLAHYALREMGFYEIARPTLHRLATESGLTAGIAILQRDQVLVIDQVESPQFIKLETTVGSLLPVHTNAHGKVLLAHLPKAEALALLKRAGLPAKTSRTIVSSDKLLAELELVRKRGYATSNEEQFVGARGLGAPIMNSEGGVVASISVVGSPAQTVWKRMDELVELVKAAAREISRSGRFRL